MKTRLPAEKFQLPVHALRCGHYSDIYFWREKRTLEQHGLHARVVMQVFQKHNAVLCGMDEALAVLRAASGHYSNPVRAEHLYAELLTPGSDHDSIESDLGMLWQDGFDALEIAALHDGDQTSPWETVMHITGDALLFAHLETVYLGILARRTRIATNVRQVVEAAAGKPVLFFPARFDHWSVQEGDGYAAFVGGAVGVSTPAQAMWTGADPLGTVPHALIAATGGHTVRAVALFGESYPDVNLVALVDFDNDCVGTALQCCEALGSRLWGVRLDTAGDVTDKSAEAAGVTPGLVEETRRQLDLHGFTHVKIIVSGGFTPDRVRRFEGLDVPVDAYGVGSWFLQGAFDFTADIVMRNGRPCAKEGRAFSRNPRLEAVS
jgi:nicotinate phosphoribosyltransferase